MRYLHSALLAWATFLADPALASPKKIAIASFGEHPALQQIVDGLKTTLSQLGHRQGIDVVYTFAHVNWDRNLIVQMLAKAAADRPDVLCTLTTPVAQAAIRSIPKSIPVVFSAIQDPVSAGLVPAWDKPSINMTGATNPADAEGTLRLIRTLMPNAHRLGFPYNPGDDADIALRDGFAAAAPKFDIELVAIGVDNINNVAERLQYLAGKVDSAYVLPSSLMQSSTSVIAATLRRLNIPAFNGLPEPVLRHEMLATYTVDWFRLGGNAATIVDQLLRGRPISELPPVNPTPQDHVTRISRQQLQQFGLTLPDSLRDCGNCLVP